MAENCCVQLRIQLLYLIRSFNDIWSRLLKTHKLRLRIFKYCDVIWIVMELSFMLLCRLQWLISSWCESVTYLTDSDTTKNAGIGPIPIQIPGIVFL